MKSLRVTGLYCDALAPRALTAMHSFVLAQASLKADFFCFFLFLRQKEKVFSYLFHML